MSKPISFKIKFMIGFALGFIIYSGFDGGYQSALAALLTSAILIYWLKDL